MAVRVDLEELRRAVQDEYAEVAENPIAVSISIPAAHSPASLSTSPSG
jgi:hypothetical protein